MAFYVGYFDDCTEECFEDLNNIPNDDHLPFAVLLCNDGQPCGNPDRRNNACIGWLDGVRRPDLTVRNTGVPCCSGTATLGQFNFPQDVNDWDTHVLWLSMAACRNESGGGCRAIQDHGRADVFCPEEDDDCRSAWGWGRELDSGGFVYLDRKSLRDGTHASRCDDGACCVRIVALSRDCEDYGGRLSECTMEPTGGLCCRQRSSFQDIGCVEQYRICVLTDALDCNSVEAFPYPDDYDFGLLEDCPSVGGLLVKPVDDVPFDSVWAKLLRLVPSDSIVQGIGQDLAIWAWEFESSFSTAARCGILDDCPINYVLCCDPFSQGTIITRVEDCEIPAYDLGTGQPTIFCDVHCARVPASPVAVEPSNAQPGPGVLLNGMFRPVTDERIQAELDINGVIECERSFGYSRLEDNFRGDSFGIGYVCQVSDYAGQCRVRFDDDGIADFLCGVKRFTL